MICRCNANFTIYFNLEIWIEPACLIYFLPCSTNPLPLTLILISLTHNSSPSQEFGPWSICGIWGSTANMQRQRMIRKWQWRHVVGRGFPHSLQMFYFLPCSLKLLSKHVPWKKTPGRWAHRLGWSWLPLQRYHSLKAPGACKKKRISGCFVPSFSWQDSNIFLRKILIFSVLIALNSLLEPHWPLVGHTHSSGSHSWSERNVSKCESFCIETNLMLKFIKLQIISTGRQRLFFLSGKGLLKYCYV